MTTAAIEPLTEKQAQAFAAIKDGSSPSDVAKTMGISPAGAHSHIKALQRKGYINDKLEILYAGPVSTDVSAAKPAAKAKPAKSAAKRRPGKAKAKPKPAPSFDEIVPPVDISNGNGNGRHPSFESDLEISRLLDSQRDTLAKSVESLALAVADHKQRITEIDGEVEALGAEKALHEDAIGALEVRSAAVIAALKDLGATFAAA